MTSKSNNYSKELVTWVYLCDEKKTIRLPVRMIGTNIGKVSHNGKTYNAVYTGIWRATLHETNW